MTANPTNLERLYYREEFENLKSEIEESKQRSKLRPLTAKTQWSEESS